MPKLYDLAHCRAGDKGNTSILSLIAYRAGGLSAAGGARHGRQPSRSTCAASCRARFAATSCRSLPRCSSSASTRLNGGVTTSLALDAHGKSLSFALLEMEI